jgi:hypothetical protein
VKQRAHCLASAGHLFDQSLFFGFRHGETQNFAPWVFDSRAACSRSGGSVAGSVTGVRHAERIVVSHVVMG